MVAPHVTSRSRLAAALTFSLLLHGVVLWLEPAQEHKVRSAPLRIELPPRESPPAPALTPQTSADPLLKNTLDAAAAPQDTPPPRLPPPIAKHGSTVTQSREAQALAAARRKIATLLFYPPQAIAEGMEGEARVLLTLDATGQVLAADLALSSGHALLDRAALQAAYAMGRVDANGQRQLLLPVIFRLR